MSDETPRNDDPTTPTESADATPAPPPPPAAADDDDDKASGGMRAFGFVFALVLAFAAAVMILVAVDIGDTLICKEANERLAQGLAVENNECFDGSDTRKTVSVGLAYVSGALGALAALFALFFAATGRHGRRLMQLATAAIVIGALSILIGSI